MPASDQVARLFALVPYLAARPNGALLDETAAAFNITPRQLIADLQVLIYCGLPEGLPGDLIEVDLESARGGFIWLSNAEFLSRPMRFSPDEATSLMVALELIGELAPELDAAAQSAIAKLTAAQGKSPAPKVGVEVAAGSEEVRAELARAISAGEVVELTYDGQTRAETTMPRVEPARLSMRDGYAYLDAWSLDRGGWRVYRADRIAEVRATGEPAGDRGKPPAFGSGWLDNVPDAVDVTLVLDEHSRWITEYIPIRASRQVADGLAVTVRVADPAWLRGQLLRLGSGVVRIEPQEAAESARHAAREALALYGN